MRSPGCQKNLSVLRKPWLRHIQQFEEGQTLHYHYLQRHERMNGTLESFAQGSLGNDEAEADDHILLNERDMMLMELTLKASVSYKPIKDLETDSMKACESEMKSSASNWPDILTTTGDVERRLLLALGVAGVVYGGLHLCALEWTFFKYQRATPLATL